MGNDQRAAAGVLCSSRFVWPTWSTSLLAHAPIVVCSRCSQQKYCVALSEKSWCDSSVCDEYMLFSLHMIHIGQMARYSSN